MIDDSTPRFLSMIFADMARSFQPFQTAAFRQPRGIPQKCRVTLAICLSLALGIVAAPMGIAVEAKEVREAREAGEATETGELGYDAEKLAAHRQLVHILPANTPMAIFLSTKQADWDALAQYELFNMAFTTFKAYTAAFEGLEGHEELEGAEGVEGVEEEGLKEPERAINPARLLAALPGVDYETDIRPWIGDQAMIAALPDKTPRSIALTDLDTRMLVVLPVTDGAAIESYLAALETSRPELPEKSTYLGAQLWVWPSRTETFSDQGWGDPNDNWQNLPEVPHEELLNLSQVGSNPTAKQNTPAKQNALGLKALGSDDRFLLPGPEVFEAEPDYNTYEVKGQAIAYVDGYLIFASEPEPLKELLDYGQFDYPRLSDSELFLRSQYATQPGAIARLYSNLSEISKYNLDGTFPAAQFPAPGLPRMPQIPGFPAPSSLSTQLETRLLAANVLKGTSLDIVVYPQTEGIRLQGRVYGNELIRTAETPDLPYADSALSFVPAPTFALSSGRDVAGLWRQIANSLSLNPPYARFSGAGTQYGFFAHWFRS